MWNRYSISTYLFLYNGLHCCNFLFFTKSLLFCRSEPHFPSNIYYVNNTFWSTCTESILKKQHETRYNDIIYVTGTQTWIQKKKKSKLCTRQSSFNINIFSKVKGVWKGFWWKRFWSTIKTSWPFWANHVIRNNGYVQITCLGTKRIWVTVWIWNSR